MIKVMLVDDHTVLRDGLRYLLEAQGDIAIIGTAGNGREAVDLALVDCPDVIIMDISMPVMNGIDATEQIHEFCPRTRIAVLSIHHNTEHIQRALQAGASGYLVKESAGTEVVDAIRTLHSGKRYFSQKITRQ